MAHHRGDGLMGFLEGLEDSHCETAKAGDVFGAEAGSDSAAVLIVVPVDDVMHAFNSPMPAVDFKYALGRCLLGRPARDSQSGVEGAFTGFFIEGFAFDEKHLP